MMRSASTAFLLISTISPSSVVATCDMFFRSSASWLYSRLGSTLSKILSPTM